METNTVINKVLEAPGIRIMYKVMDREQKLQVQAKLTKELVAIHKEQPSLTEDELVELFTVMFMSILNS